MSEHELQYGEGLLSGAKVTFEGGTAADVQLPTSTAQRRKFADDVRWAYHNVGNPDAVEREAPTPGAWWLRQMAIDTNGKFLQPFLTQMAKSEEQDEEELEIRKDCTRTRDELMRTIDRLLKAPF